MAEEEKVIIQPEEVKDTSQESIEVTPPPKTAEEDQLAAKIKADFEALYGSRISQVEKQFENFRHGAYRIQDDLKKENERLKQELQKPKSVSEPQTVSDPWSTIQDGPRWKQEIEQLAERKAEEKLKAWHTEQQTVLAQYQQQQIQDTSKRQVIAKYPELDPETGNTGSPVSKAYVAVLAEHPDWLANPYGPTLAMYAMEEKLIAEQTASAGASAKPRTSIASSTASRPATSSGERLSITREMKQFVDRSQLNPEQYAKVAAALEQQGAIEA